MQLWCAELDVERNSIVSGSYSLPRGLRDALRFRSLAGRSGFRLTELAIYWYVIREGCSGL